TIAKKAFSEAKARNISFLIGPQSSSELTAIKPLADASQILVVSHSSTAGSLAIPNDAIFRFCPSDKIEGKAMAKTIYDAGIRGLVTVGQNDAGNRGLQLSVNDNFAKLGGQITSAPAYEGTTPDFPAVIADLKTRVSVLSVIHGEAKVAVYLASFDEAVAIFKLAANEPVLKGVKWYGGDGVVLSNALAADADAADFAIATGFFAPSYGLSPAYESKWKPVAMRIKESSGIDPDAFALVAYDALWTIAHTIEAKFGGVSTFDEIKLAFAKQANKDAGITGPNTLDVNGDRATGTFDYFGLVKDGSTYKWVLTGESE
ncbi:MAG: amino acid ABC transporter substrate-binding protein, partial [Sphingobacteriales bacterium]